MEVVFSLKDVSISRSGQRVWSDGNFSIPKGAVIGVIGPNGSGKTTLLEMLVGLLRPTSGELVVLGETPRRGNSRIGYVPQDSATRNGSVLRSRDFVALGIHGPRFGIHKTTTSETELIENTLRRVDALHLADRRLGELSGGQQQRVAIAQALVGNPQLLLLDEPLANLDMRNQHDVVELITELTHERELTVVIVAHDLNPLLTVLTGAVYLLDGHAHFDEINNVVDEALLSHLYGTAVKVVKTPQGDLFTRNA